MSMFSKELRISWLSPFLARTPPTPYLPPVLRRLTPTLPHPLALVPNHAIHSSGSGVESLPWYMTTTMPLPRTPCPPPLLYLPLVRVWSPYRGIGPKLCPPPPRSHPIIPSSGPGVEPFPRYLTSAKVASTVCGSSGRTSCRNGRSPYAMISVFDPLTFSRTNRR